MKQLVSVCVCVRETERERERDKVRMGMSERVSVLESQREIVHVCLKKSESICAVGEKKRVRKIQKEDHGVRKIEN